VGGEGGGGRSPILIAGVVLVVVATVAVIAVAVSAIGFGGGSSSASAACTTQSFPSAKNEASAHLPADDAAARAKVKWDSDPPTHGTHDPVPALWGVYDTEVDQAKLIHNMEHAGVVVQYGPKVPQKDVSALLSDVQTDYQWMVVAPYAKLGDKIAYEYWGHLTTCAGYSSAALSDLRKQRNVPGWSQESQAYPQGRDWTQEARLPGY
jgi:hypothetical protein